eukprot:g7864.t1
MPDIERDISDKCGGEERAVFEVPTDVREGCDELYVCKLQDVPHGVSEIKSHIGHPILLWRTKTFDYGFAEAIKATRNNCLHRNGNFSTRAQDIEDSTLPNGGSQCVVQCTHHNWKLNLKTMIYENPEGSRKQPQLICCIEGRRKIGEGGDDESGDHDGGCLKTVKEENLVRNELFDDEKFLVIYEKQQAKPWCPELPRPEKLEKNEFTVSFFAHACVEIRAGEKTLFTDPWLAGPAFVRGWWLLHRPPKDWLQRIGKADFVYLSHAHEDHANPYTLKILHSHYPEMKFLIARQPLHPLKDWLHIAGFREGNILEVEAEKWLTLNDDLRVMILWDLADPDCVDTLLLVEYKGYRRRLVSPLPYEILQHAKKRNKLLCHQIAKWCIQTQARLYMPFAGGFTEGGHMNGPCGHYDEDFKRRNHKNTPAEACRTVARLTDGKSGTQFRDAIDEALQAELEFEPLRTMEGLRKYFKWVETGGYFSSHNVVLHVVEQDMRLSKTIREWFLDFRDLTLWEENPRDTRSGAGQIGQTLYKGARPNYERMRVRAVVLRRVMREGGTWDTMFSGMQAVFFREPDVYNEGYEVLLESYGMGTQPLAAKVFAPGGG